MRRRITEMMRRTGVRSEEDFPSNCTLSFYLFIFSIVFFFPISPLDSLTVQLHHGPIFCS